MTLEPFKFQPYVDCDLTRTIALRDVSAVMVSACTPSSWSPPSPSSCCSYSPLSNSPVAPHTTRVVTAPPLPAPAEARATPPTDPKSPTPARESPADSLCEHGPEARKSPRATTPGNPRPNNRSGDLLAALLGNERVRQCRRAPFPVPHPDSTRHGLRRWSTGARPAAAGNIQTPRSRRGSGAVAQSVRAVDS